MRTEIEKLNKNFISNIYTLLAALDIEESLAIEVFTQPESDRYRRHEVRKKDGSPRIVYAPSAKIKLIQNRIKKNILSSSGIIGWPHYLYGSIKNTKSEDGTKQIRDYVSCANNHTGAKSLLTVDIKDFFDNIHKDIVKKIIEKYISKDNEVIEFILNICCHEDRLIQGAPTSSYFANLALYDVEPKIYKKLTRKGLTYTRFVDDISVSSKIYDYDFSYSLNIIKESLQEKGLFLNEKKISIRNAGSEPLTVHGLRIDFHNARLPSEEIKKIRAHIKMLEDMASVYKIRTHLTYREEYARCMGRVNKLKRTGHNKHKEFVGRLKKISPIASRSEVEFCSKLLDKLKLLYPTDKDRLFYKKKYFWLLEKLYIVRVSFPKSAIKMINELKKIPPKYEKK